MTTTVEESLDVLQQAAMASVADAQGSVGVLAPEVRPVWAGARVFGPAYTARCYQGSIITVHKALLEAKPGDVLVVDAGHDATGAMFGAMMATEARNCGLAGLVTDGAVRDVGHLARMRYPVFSARVTGRVGTNRRVGQTGLAVSCGGVVIEPGDYVLGDDDGVVVIPRAGVAEVAEAVRAIQAKEAGWQEKMAAGEHLADLIGFRALIFPGG